VEFALVKPKEVSTLPNLQVIPLIKIPYHTPRAQWTPPHEDDPQRPGLPGGSYLWPIPRPLLQTPTHLQSVETKSSKFLLSVNMNTGEKIPPSHFHETFIY